MHNERIPSKKLVHIKQLECYTICCGNDVFTTNNNFRNNVIKCCQISLFYFHNFNGA